MLTFYFSPGSTELVMVNLCRDAFKALEAALLKDNILQGDVVRSIVEKYGTKEDLNMRRATVAEGFL